MSDENDSGCGLFCLPFGRKHNDLNEKSRHKDDDEVDLFEEDYEDLLKSHSVVVPGDDEFDELPTGDLLEDLYKMQMLDRNRQKITFGEINCYGYVKALSKELPLSKLDKLRPSTRLTIIGCGDPILIPQYIEQTECPFEIYADPSRSLYNKLGFAISAAPPPETPRYVSKYSLPFMTNIGRSLKLAAKSKSLAAGPVTQVGGELVWIDGELQHMHRMQNAGDHMETNDLIKLLRRQERELNMREGSIRTKDESNAAGGSKRNSLTRVLSRLSSIVSM